MQYFLDAIKNNYANFSGRARRKQYWMFVLFNFIFGLVVNGIDLALGMDGTAGGMGVVSGIYSLALLIPGIAIAVRRLHDIGKSGWWLLIILIPLIGFIWLIVLLATDSQRETNKWGNSPKYGAGEDIADHLVD